MKTDVLIVGSGCSALYMALHLSEDLNILMVTKKEAELSDSFLAQGGICMLRNEDDYDSYFEDTMKAGHYENDAYSVELMIKSEWLYNSWRSRQFPQFIEFFQLLFVQLELF